MLALVLPVLAQATLFAPSLRAALAPQVMPRSLKLPVGFSPSCLNQRSERPAHLPAEPAGYRRVLPS